MQETVEASFFVEKSGKMCYNKSLYDGRGDTMRIAVCDDEKEVTEQLKRYLQTMQPAGESRWEVCLFCDADDFLYEVETGKPYDIVFLDIEIGDYNGIDIALKIKELYPAVLIIFMTAHHQYVYETFEAQPVGFVRKPMKDEDIQKVFLRALKVCDDMPALNCPFNGGVYRVLLKEILYIEIRDRKVAVMHAAGESLFYESIDDIEKELRRLSSNFCRISHSVIINMRYVRAITLQKVVLYIHGEEVLFVISRKYQKQVRETYMNYLE